MTEFKQRAEVLSVGEKWTAARFGSDRTISIWSVLTGSFHRSPKTEELIMALEKEWAS
jgi:hypothetical protein